MSRLVSSQYFIWYPYQSSTGIEALNLEVRETGSNHDFVNF